MKLYLAPEVKIRDIRKEFQYAFPYLKLEFFRKKHHMQEGTPLKDIVPGNATLLEVTGVMREGEIEIKSAQTVAEVEQAFQNRFYLPVQIFRKTRHSWIETTKTDHLTLARQNRMGREACGAIYDTEVLL